MALETNLKRSNSEHSQMGEIAAKKSKQDENVENVINNNHPATPIDLPQNAPQHNFELLLQIISPYFNPTNAFDYNLINVMNTFIQHNNIDFKLAAIVLEAGTKVWTSKVNLLWSSSLKLHNTLLMAIEDINETDNDRKFTQKAKKKIQPKKSTIVTNLNTINSKFKTNNLKFDPQLYQLSSTFDIANVNSLLMANLPQNLNGVLLLNSDESLNFNLPPICNSLSSLSSFNTTSSRSDTICPELAQLISNFSFRSRPIEQQQQMAEVFQFNLNASVDDVEMENNSSNEVFIDLSNFLEINLTEAPTVENQQVVPVVKKTRVSGNRKEKNSTTSKMRSQATCRLGNLNTTEQGTVGKWTSEREVIRSNAGDNFELISNFSINEEQFNNSHTELQLPIVDSINSISYSKVYKSIDIKRLKKVMWKIIEKSSSDATELSLEGSTQDDASPQQSITFSALGQSLQNAINQQNNLSIPTSFVALLHLCNDKNLQLSSIEEDENSYSDFTIHLSRTD